MDRVVPEGEYLSKQSIDRMYRSAHVLKNDENDFPCLVFDRYEFARQVCKAIHHQYNVGRITDDEIKRLIVEGARKFECLGDWCLLIDYDPDVGKVPERWEPQYDVFHAASYVVRSLQAIQESS